MKRLLPVLIASLLYVDVWAQFSNVIPNAGFENIIGAPEKWFYTGADFDKVFNEWKSPTSASPDVYHEQIAVPAYWRENGFDHIKPFRGKSKIGLTLYGCNKGKLHCREYVTAALLDSLVIGQEYYFSMWVAPMLSGLSVDQMQVAFDKKPITTLDDRVLDIKPLYNLPIKSSKEWQRIEVRFYAETEATHITIGNFRNDRDTKTQIINKDSIQNFAYYYIDEMTMFKIPPILPRDIVTMYDSIQLAKSPVTLQNIYFNTDETRLLPESYMELNKLLLLLNAKPYLKIRITGHTDNVGTKEYNQKLSKQRADAVADFLIRHYIDAFRIQTKGVGAEQPIASNDEESGRKQNRRVIFEVMR